MLDLGWSEMLIIGVVTLIVVGPKDLPKMLRTLGQYAGRAKGIARDFQRSMDDAARQADIEELHEVKKGLDDMRDAQYKMQREMGQSFLDGPSNKKTDEKPAEKSGEAKAPEAEKPKADAPGSSAGAAVKPKLKKAAAKATKKSTEPVSEPGSVSGA
jgi:sec-independent protein translocase protein TatB